MFSPFVRFREFLYVAIILYVLPKDNIISEVCSVDAYIPPPKGSGFYAPAYKHFVDTCL